ncbi:hypothetical protein PPL_10861 [Heterostelium album PN500]|uniref:F-box domain-containing protein n=1 Tax=Heterostelium pallidum (strain ATCC 26659 / Pp 5 / PN500) TaxID=670386 RepID=D3BS69_HETP5|nr:hypothetical protein PPL_10861 [Heterostelium album PN500]EFA75806.1 hypothetical protein PPL_10861 [Heterostelium album PN500]|eukprot:XP_020427940.1 hypothetical protein PPL_10861 [Heterostelium album PN500]
MSTNNNTCRFVNLPHIILFRIIKEIENDIDRVCFSLVCKRWFDQRHSYLSFNCQDLMIYQSHMIKNVQSNQFFTLKSYINLFQSGLDQIPDHAFIIPESRLKHPMPVIYSHFSIVIDLVINYYQILFRLCKQLESVSTYQLPLNLDILPLNIKEIISYYPMKECVLPLALERLEFNLKYGGAVDIDFSLLPDHSVLYI